MPPIYYGENYVASVKKGDKEIETHNIANAVISLYGNPSSS